MSVKAFDVHISDSAQRAIRRRCARRYPNEYGEAMFIRRGVGEFHVEKFVKIRILKVSPDEIQWDELDFKAVQNQCKREGYEFATIHSHPDCSDSAPSSHDHCDGVGGEVLMGIVAIKKDKKSGHLRTNLGFWIPQLPAKINLIHD